MTKQQKHRKKHGFSLVELSIVLMIIGLLVGGVMVGKDLIKSSENRAFVSQLQRYNAAVNAFKLKYNCTPGDCANATDYGLTGNGNGNGMVSGLADWSTGLFADYSPAPPIGYSQVWLGSVTSNGFNPEVTYFWSHLRDAGFIAKDTNTVTLLESSGASYAMPSAKNDGTIIIATGWNGKHYFKSGAIGIRRSGNLLWSNNFSPADAAYIFEKMGGTTITTTNANANYPDNLGKERVIVSNWNSTYGPGFDNDFYHPFSRGVGGANADYCIDSSVTPVYFNLKNSKKLCMLIIQADF